MKGKVVIRIDTLSILKDVVGEEIYKDRNKLYKLLSASGVTNRVYQILFERAYLDSERFRFYVDGQFLFKSPEENLLSVVIAPLREKVDKYQVELFNRLTSSGFKYLMSTHDYVYYATSKAPIPELEGLTVI